MVTTLIVAHAGVTDAQTLTPADYVSPFIGTGGANHDFPGAVLPFGMVAISPDTNLTHAGGYNFGDPDIMGFSQVHEEGVGCRDLGNILIMPTTGTIATSEPGYQSPYNGEVASPGYYKVNLLKSGVTAEMTATDRASYSKYTFPARTGDANILIDVTHALSEFVQGGTVTVVSPTEVQGQVTSGHRCGFGNLQTVYFDAQFSKAATQIGTWNNGSVSQALTQTGQHVGAYFSTSTTAGESVYVRIGVSYVSVANAAQNLNTEIPAGETFDQVVAAARATWNTELGKIAVTGGTHDQTVEFYTALYHSLLMPNILSDVNGQYPASTGNGFRTAVGYVQYDFFNTWDQYRSNFALLALGWPERESDMMKSVVAIYNNSGWLPKWHFAGNEVTNMVGDSIDPIITGAYLRGIHDFDVNTAYAAMLKGATQKSYQRPGLSVYNQYGYVPADNSGGDYVWGPVSTSLEYYYDDWSIAQLAQVLGKSADYQSYFAHSQNYPKLFDPSVGFMRPRNASGSWVSPFNPTSSSDKNFVEGTPWQYLWNVPHDMPGLIALLGGDQAFTNKLQQYFDSNLWTVTNEHDLADPYWFDSAAGQAWHTQKTVRTLVAGTFNTTPGGIGKGGNDDSGALSSFYVFNAMGFFPASPASPSYLIGSPYFNSITIKLNPQYYPGGQFQIQAVNNGPTNLYIQSATLNGNATNNLTLNHSTMANGGVLVLNMGSAPSSWGGAGDKGTIDTVGIYRRSNGNFYLRLHNASGYADLTVNFHPGSAPYPVVGDWSGSGDDTIGVYDQRNGRFFLRNTNTPGTADQQFTLGNPNDLPVAGHWSLGAAHSGGGTFRPTNGLIFLKDNLTTGYADHTMILGLPGDTGLAGDWNHKGFDSPGVYRPGTSYFYLSNLVTNGAVYGNYEVQYGISGDTPLAGDWVAQGHDGIGLFRQRNGFTYLKDLLVTGYADMSFTYGIAGDVPVAGHWQAIYPPIPGISASPGAMTAVPQSTSVAGSNQIGD